MSNMFLIDVIQLLQVLLKSLLSLHQTFWLLFQEDVSASTKHLQKRLNDQEDVSIMQWL